MGFITLLIVIIAVLALSVWLFIIRQGDAEFYFIVDQRTEFTLTNKNQDSATFTCKVPFVNKGTQDGTIMDAYTRHLLPSEQYDAVDVYSRLTLESNQRTDGYWEAFIVPKTTGDAVIVTVKLTATDGNIDQALANMVDMPVEIVYQVVGRSDWYITKSRVVMTNEEIKRALTAFSAA